MDGRRHVYHKRRRALDGRYRDKPADGRLPGNSSVTTRGTQKRYRGRGARADDSVARRRGRAGRDDIIFHLPSLNRFLRQGSVVTAGNSFRVDRRVTREKLLETQHIVA